MLELWSVFLVRWLHIVWILWIQLGRLELVAFVLLQNQGVLVWATIGVNSLGTVRGLAGNGVGDYFCVSL